MKLLHRIFPLAIGLTAANCPVAAVGTVKTNVTLKFMKMHKAYILLVLSTVMCVVPAGAQIPENKADPGKFIAYEDRALSFTPDGEETPKELKLELADGVAMEFTLKPVGKP